MASLNQVSIELKVTGEREATQALKRYSDASDKLNRSVLNAASKIKSAESAWDRANKLYKEGTINGKALSAAQKQIAREIAIVNGYLKSNGALNTQKALAELKAAQATREAAAAEAAANAERQRAQQGYNQLRAAIDQSYAARMRLKQAADTLRAAERQGIITRQQAIEQLRLYRDAAQASAAAGNMAARRTNQLGVLMQQTGYQVGDFAVQVQSGTHFMVALGQQATQLVGTFAMLARSTRMIALFSGLGVVVPIVTAIAGGFMRAGESAEKSSVEIEGAFSTLPDFFDKLGEDISGSFGDAFDKIESRYGEMFKRLAEIKLMGVKEALTKSFAETVVPVESPSFMERLGSALAPGVVMGSSEALSDINKQTDALYEQQLAVIEIEKTYAQKVKSANSMSALINLTLETERLLASISREAADAFILQAEKAGIVTEMTKGSSEALRQQVTHQMQIATLQKEINAGVNEILASRDAELQKQQDRVTLAQTELQFGKESQAYRDAQLAIEERILREQLAQNGILGNNAQKIVDAWREASNLEQAVANARDAAFDLADEIGEAATNALKLAGIDITSGINSAAAAAKALAIRLGASVDAALALINIEGGMKQQSGPRRESGRTLPQVTANIPGSLGEAYRRSLGIGEFAGGGGGGGAADTGIGSLAQSLLTQQEKIDMWREESLVKLQEFNTRELEILGGHAEARRRIEEEYASRITEIQNAERSERLNAYSSLFGSLATIADVGGKRLLKVQAVLSGAATMIAAYEAAMKAAAEAKTIPGRLAAYAAFVAKGIQTVQQIKSIGSGGGGGAIGGGIGAPASPTAAVTSQAPAAPQRVIIEGLDRDSLISGEQLQNIFDKLYEENEDRGFVFQVAR